MVHPLRDILEFPGAVIASAIAIIRCAFRIPYYRVGRVDPNHVRVLEYNVCPGRVRLELVVLAVEHQRYRMVSIYFVYFVVREACRVRWIAPPIRFICSVPEEEIFAGLYP